MTTDFEVFDGGMSVRHPDGRFQPVRTPLGFTDLAFRNAVAAYDTAYRMIGKLPSVDEVFKAWPKVPKKTYATLFASPEFQQALRYRGIEVDPDAGLSYEQNMVLLKLSDHTDRRSLGVKLKEMGVPFARYQNWLKQPHFSAASEKMSKDGYRDALPTLRTQLIAEAGSGNQRALEMVFAITGEWNPAAQEVQNAQAVVLSVVEAVIRHVRDPETRRQILADVALTAGTLAATTPDQPALE